MVEILEVISSFVSVLCVLNIFEKTALYPYYLDPGTGSIILQVVIGSVLGAAFLVKIFWRKLTAFFSRIFATNKKGNE